MPELIASPDGQKTAGKTHFNCCGSAISKSPDALPANSRQFLDRAEPDLELSSSA
jgi:hypothetical protein